MWDVCEICGAVVANVQRHELWHAAMDPPTTEHTPADTTAPAGTTTTEPDTTGTTSEEEPDGD